MVKFLINLGLVLIPYMIWRGIDVRIVHEITGLGVALAIGLYALYTGSLKRFKNYWWLLFIGFVFISMLNSPKFTSFMLAYRDGNQLSLLARRPMSGFWMFKPYLFIIAYALVMITIASCSFSRKEIIQLFTIMAIAGFIMALYVFIQAVELDQFFHEVPVENNPDVAHLRRPKIGGFIGHSTLVSPYILMIIPIALYLRRYFWALCMGVAVALTTSKVAIVAMAIGIPVYFLLSKRMTFRVIGALLILSIWCSGVYYYHTHPNRDWVDWAKHKSSGRSGAWPEIWKDFITPPIEGDVTKYTVTGFGPGTLEYSHPVRHNNKWWKAHCEPLEILYNFGIMGSGLILMALWYMLKHIFIYYTHDTDYELILALSFSFICILLCSLGTFPFQIASTMYYTVVVIGLLHNENLLGGKYAPTKSADQ